jgi:hypothetical protein
VIGKKEEIRLSFGALCSLSARLHSCTGYYSPVTWLSFLVDTQIPDRRNSTRCKSRWRCCAGIRTKADDERSRRRSSPDLNTRVGCGTGGTLDDDGGLRVAHICRVRRPAFRACQDMAYCSASWLELHDYEMIRAREAIKML